MNTDETDLAGLDFETAREYILAYSVDLKRLERETAETKAELDRWTSRVALAEGKLAASPEDANLSGLAEAARAKAAEASGKLDALEAERTELRGKIERMKVQLPMVKARERSIDPDRLLAELQLMTGELLNDRSEGGAGAPEADFAKLEADEAAARDLESLKLRAAAEGMAGGSNKAAGGAS